MPACRPGRSPRRSSRPAGKACWRASTPDDLHQVQFRRIRRQLNQGDVVRNPEPLALLVPSGTVADQHGVCARRHLGADLLEVLVHALGVGGRQDDGSALSMRGADRAIHIGGVMTIVAHHGRSRAAFGPDVGMPALLSDPGFVLEPDLDQLALGRGRQGVPTQDGKICLKASCAAKS
jgi:hypothetical protein